MLKDNIKNIIENIKLEPRKILNNELVFGVVIISGLLFLYYSVFARLLFSGEYTFGGDTYMYWSFKYLILYSIKHFNSLPWWDPTSYGGYPLYYHFISGWTNFLSPYYMPSIIIFKVLSLFFDVSINSYIIFHRTIYVISLNMIAIYLISRELITNRIARVLPVFIFSFSYFQLMNFHDFYAIEAMIAPLFYIFALIRFNNKRTTGNLILLLLFLSLLLASIHYGIFMSALYWIAIFTVLMLAFNISMIKDAYRLLLDLVKTAKGKVIFGMLLLMIVSGLISVWLPFHYNAGHVLRYRGWDEAIPLAYDTAGSITSKPVSIVSSEIWTILFGWLPFPDIHDNLLRFAWHGHENRYIGLATLPLIFTAITLCLKNRYTYILFLTYLLCNAFVIYATDNIAYKILTDNSDIFRNITNMSTIFPRGGPLLFLIFLAGIGLDRLVGIATKNETIEGKDVPFERLFKRTIAVLIFIACALILVSIMSGMSPMFSWLRHSLSHIGIYLLIFSFMCRILIISNNKIIRRAILFCLLLFTFTDLTVSASSIILGPRPFQQGDIYSYMLGNTLVPYNMLSEIGATIPDNAVFMPANSVSEQMFPENYRGGYHNAPSMHWGIKEWLVLATREDSRRFLPNWNPQYIVMGRFPTLRMTQYPTFQLFSNGYYLPFEKIRELDTDKSIYYAEPLFYLHDEQLVNSKRTHPQEPVRGSYAIKEYTPNKAVIESTTDRDGFLYFLDNYDRFWSAYIDGKEVKIHRANFAFKAVELPAGTHTVSWVYNPYPVKIAYGVFYLILTAFISYFAILIRKDSSFLNV